MEGGTNYTCTALSQDWPDSSLSGLSPPHTSYLQVKAESGPIQGIDEGSGGPYVGNLLPQSTFQGHEGVPPAPFGDPARIDHTDLNATYSPCKDVSSTVTEVSRKKHAALPSQTTVQPADTHGTPKSLYPCDKCDKQYTQLQGVTRHQREAHEISLCPICNDFRWKRRHQLTKHLMERHPDINLDVTLCKVTSCRRGATMSKKHLRQQQASPPATECDRRSHGEPLPYSLMHTLPAVVKEKLVTSCKREDARGLDLFDPITNGPSASSSTEERPQPPNDAQHGQIWPSLARTGGYTPADRPSSLVPVPIPILYWPYDSMAAFSSRQISSIPRGRFYTEIDPRKHWAGPNRRY